FNPSDHAEQLARRQCDRYKSSRLPDEHRRGPYCRGQTHSHGIGNPSFHLSRGLVVDEADENLIAGHTNNSPNLIVTHGFIWLEEFDELAKFPKVSCTEHALARFVQMGLITRFE